MLDIRRLRTEPDAVRAGLSRRGADAAASLDEIVAADEQQRAIGTKRDEIRARIKALSKDVGQLRKDGDADGAEALMAESRLLGEEEKALDAEADEHGDRVLELLLRTPNLPANDAPDGAGEADNVVIRTEGYDPGAYGDHQRVPHWDIGESLGILEPERAVKITGSMFTMYRGWGARLLRAMVQLSLDRNADAYEEVRPPTLVTHRDDDLDRPPAEVRRRRLPPRARRPLGDPHGRGAAHVARTADEVVDEAAPAAPVHGATRRASAARRARPAATPAVCCAATSSTRSSSRADQRAEQAIACQEDVLARSESISETSASPTGCSTCAPATSAAAARTWDIEAYVPGCDLLARGRSVSWFARLPGPSRRHSLQADRRQRDRGVPHRQRLGHGLAPDGRRVPRDPPSARRRHRHRRLPAGLPRWSGVDPRPTEVSTSR